MTNSLAEQHPKIFVSESGCSQVSSNISITTISKLIQPHTKNPINQQQSNAHVTNNECTKVRKTPNVLNNWYVQYSEMARAIFNVYYIYNSQGLATEG